MDIKALQYPIGLFMPPRLYTREIVDLWVDQMEVFPADLRSLVGQWSNERLNTPYRPGGWTVRQVVHHLADSHHNSYTRFKWALTEPRPLIKAYDEKEWAELLDSRTAPIALSLDYLAVLHAKMVFLFRKLSDMDLGREFVHPDGDLPISLAENLGRYAWHGLHHLAQIKGLADREGW